MQSSNGVSGLTVIPPNHILSHLTPKASLSVKITPKAVQDISINGPTFTIVGVRFHNHNLEVDVGYIYNGGDFCAFSDLQRSNTNIPEVHIYLNRTTPTDFKVKGRYLKDTLIIPLENACFSSPVAVHLHNKEDQQGTGQVITKDVIIQL